MRKVQKHHGLIILPVFGGTLSEMEASQYTLKQIPLPPLRPQDIESIMKEEEVISLYTGKLKYFWDLIGVVPRHLEWAVGESKLMNSLIPIETRISTIKTRISERISEYYKNSSCGEILRYLAILTLSGFTLESQPLLYRKEFDELVSQGLIYMNNTHIGLPLPAIDTLSTNFDNIPKDLLADFITQPNKEDCEILEEFCLKTIICRLNYFVVVSKIKDFSIGNLFKGCIFSEKLGNLNVFTKVNGFTYRDSIETLSNEIITEYNVTKVKKNQNGIDGCLPTLFTHEEKKILFVTQNKFVKDDFSSNAFLQLSEIIAFYEEALMKIDGYEVYAIILTNKKVSDIIKSMIVNGKMKYNKEVENKNEEYVCNCEKLILISGECFESFFHPYLYGTLGSSLSY